jgi:Family of unknown function (DUF6812)
MSTAINMPPHPPTALRNRARRCIVRIDTEDAVLVGTIYIPDNRRRVSDVLADERPFLNMTDVSVNGSDQVESFIALNKNFIRTLRIVHEMGPRPAANPAIRS